MAYRQEKGIKRLSSIYFFANPVIPSTLPYGLMLYLLKKAYKTPSTEEENWWNLTGYFNPNIPEKSR